MEKLDELKPIIRSILLSLGKQATEKDFRTEYYNHEGESFNEVLSAAKKNFFQFMRGIPDVCRVWDDGQEIMLQRVSTSASRHMDNLTILTKKQSQSKPKRFIKHPGNQHYFKDAVKTAMPKRQNYSADLDDQFSGLDIPSNPPRVPLAPIAHTYNRVLPSPTLSYFSQVPSVRDFLQPTSTESFLGIYTVPSAISNYTAKVPSYPISTHLPPVAMKSSPKIPSCQISSIYAFLPSDNTSYSRRYKPY